jgi:hypothetical protein
MSYQAHVMTVVSAAALSSRCFSAVPKSCLFDTNDVTVYRYLTSRLVGVRARAARRPSHASPICQLVGITAEILLCTAHVVPSLLFYDYSVDIGGAVTSL